MLTRLVVIILQYIQIPSHYVVHLIRILVNYISLKRQRERHRGNAASAKEAT